jgi:DNA-binding transcriptional regulator YhcF (GntR family)
MPRTTGITLKPERLEPLYRQLFDQVVARIRTGAMPAGHRLPPTRALAMELKTHRNTVVRAYAELEAAGFIESTVGRGTFVRAAARERANTEPVAKAVPTYDPMPWSTLMSNTLSIEPLQRTARLARRKLPGDPIDLASMHASFDLMPHALLRRCFDHVLRTQMSKVLGYAPREGVPRLREQISLELRGASCFSLGFTGGNLKCTDQCSLDTSECQRCGNGFLEPGEVCDLVDVSCADKLGPEASGWPRCNHCQSVDFGSCLMDFGGSCTSLDGGTCAELFNVYFAEVEAWCSPSEGVASATAPCDEASAVGRCDNILLGKLITYAYGDAVHEAKKKCLGEWFDL